MEPGTDSHAYNIIYEDVFNGPIGLLVELVQRKKIDIYDISLSYIIRGFTDYINEKENASLDTMSGFVYFSSILLEIKSRTLLPSKKMQEEEKELDVNILKRREEEYRVFKKVSNYLNGRIQEGALLLVREAPIEKSLMDILPDFMEKVDIIQLWNMAGRLLAGSRHKLDIEDVYNHRSTINIFEEMKRIKNVLSSRKEITFRELSSVHKLVIDRIISFLSLLELYKNEEIEILQFESFGNIIIKFK